MKLVKPLLAISLACCAVPALAAGTAATAAAPVAAAAAPTLISSMRIAVVNVQLVMRDSTAAKSVREALEAKQKAYQSEISRKEESLQKEDQELAKQRSTLSKDAFDAKVKTFRDKATAVQKEVAAKKEAWDNAYQSSVVQIQKTVGDIVTEIAREKGFAMAVPASELLYADNSLDISQEVLSRLNTRLPKIDVKFEAPAAGSETYSSSKKKRR